MSMSYTVSRDRLTKLTVDRHAVRRGRPRMECMHRKPLRTKGIGELLRAKRVCIYSINRSGNRMPKE